MFPYLFICIPIALMAVASPRAHVHSGFWFGAFAALVCFVGLRHHVGMDWNNYLLMIENVTQAPLPQALAFAEPGYALLLRESGKLGLGVYGANLVVALIFIGGLFRYARTTPNPWLALLVALPILVVAVGMSANRQAAAIGVLLWAVAGWDRYSLWQRVLLVAVATSFHASAVLFLVFIAADVKMNGALKLVAIAFVSVVGLYVLEASGKMDYYNDLYVTGQTELTESSGALFHTFLNGGPATIYFMLGKYRAKLLPNALHRNMALMAIALVPLSLVVSAASGRVSLYMFPVSIYLFAAIPRVLRGGGTKFVYKVGCSTFFAALLVFWLLASNSGHAHLPYRNLLEIYPSERELCC
jgi:hypothetical protein